MASRRLIFLDIDGVICCNTSGKLEETKLAELKRIVQQTGAKIVLSSDWRRQPALKSQARNALKRIGAECVGATPMRAMYQPLRPQEITDWLRTSGRGVLAWVAIDDRDLTSEMGGPALTGHFVRTHPSTGLTSRLADRVVRLLTEEAAPPSRASTPGAGVRGGQPYSRATTPFSENRFERGYERGRTRGPTTTTTTTIDSLAPSQLAAVATSVACGATPGGALSSTLPTPARSVLAASGAQQQQQHQPGLSAQHQPHHQQRPATTAAADGHHRGSPCRPTTATGGMRSCNSPLQSARAPPACPNTPTATTRPC